MDADTQQNDKTGELDVPEDYLTAYACLLVQMKTSPMLYAFTIPLEMQQKFIEDWKREKLVHGIVEMEAAPSEGRFQFNADEILYTKQATRAEYDQLNNAADAAAKAAKARAMGAGGGRILTVR